MWGQAQKELKPTILLTLQESAVKHGAAFIEQLARTSEQLLLQFDNMLTVDDIERGSKFFLKISILDSIFCLYIYITWPSTIKMLH